MAPLRLAAILLAVCLPSITGAQTRYDTPWAHVEAPSSGPARAIGGAAAGCIAGAAALPAEGEGFQVLRRWRNRFWGHGDLVAYLKRLGGRQAAAGFGPLLIGDMSQPRGGPMAFGHRSHQIGIDVDILFTTGPMSADARESLRAPPSMLAGDGRTVATERFGPAQIAMLRSAAGDPAVARIFVNFHLKKYLCDRLPAAERGWLHKVRPWLGHDEHFHVRLLCPADSPSCREQAPIPAGDGCGDDLAQWFRPPPPRDPNAPKPKPPSAPVLPAACDAVLTAP
ncbi:penicillin-insensitive murein endopeptidase [Zavarzinia compransoris]|uniref:penicillin-insensitive murein endopeptidase n=1 Tax=Zavarzinia marina TaxID=2911065 RepID=UPI001F3BC221|nr:penicillin-insensitive murein endopeptidase [Zavarzinia marina]MCF4167463.1 penicillin-insensitive murein endopeptidase [Zavarzinia marina]